MLGDLVGENRGQVTNTRVLPSEPGQGPKVEISFETHGTLLGIDTHEMGTYSAVARPDGLLFGEGQGVFAGDAGSTVAKALAKASLLYQPRRRRLD